MGLNFPAQIADNVRKVLLDDIYRANYNSSGEIFWVFEDSDQDFQKMSNKHPKNVFTTYQAALNAVTSNRNDVIFVNGHSSHIAAAIITNSKNRVHTIGMDGVGGRVNSQSAKITMATAVATDIAVISNTGTRNTYENLKIVQTGTNVAQTSAFIDTGEGTVVKNCEMEVNTILTTATQGLLFKGDTCEYINCQIGNSTVYHTAANQAPLVIQTPARYSYFIDCRIINYSSQTSASCIDCPDANSVIGWIMFENCKLISANLGDGATAGGTMAEAVTSVVTSGYLYFDSRCNSFNAAIFAEADTSILLAAADGGTATLGGVAVAAA